MEKIVSKYLAHLGIPVSKSYFEKQVVAHPDYPSLLSISDTLQRLGIVHHAARVKNLDSLSFPYLVHIDNLGGRLLPVKDQGDLDTYKSDLKDWKGIVLKVEPTDTIVDEEHNEQYTQERLQNRLSIALCITLLGLLLLPFAQAGSWLLWSLFFTALGGTVVGYLLMAKDLGITYKPVETFCNAGKRTNCDRILNAKDATLFGFFTFSDAAASYFIFQLIAIGLFVPLFEGAASFLLVLAVAGVLAIPIIGYSLYYQYVKANTWCRLCVIVDAVLSIQIILFIILFNNQFFALTDVSFVPISVSVFLFATILSSIVLLKNRLEEVKALSWKETVAKRVKHDPEVFTQLLLKEEKIDTTPFNPEIMIGNPEASVKVVMVVNLHCNPCKTAFNTVRQILASYPAMACFSIRFTKGMDNTIGELSASTYIIHYWYNHIYGIRDEGERTKKLLINWYNQMDPEAFMKQYPLEVEKNYEKLENRHYEWVKQHGIVSTPTFFVNGYKMPQNYQIKDLMALIPGLTVLWKEAAQTDVKEFA